MDAGLVTEEQFLKALAVRHDVPFVQPEPGLVDTTLLARASLPYLTRHQVLPVQITDKTLTAIMADPLNETLIQELERIYGVPVKPCAASGAQITEALQTLKRVREGRPMTSSTSLQYRDLETETGATANPEGAVGILDYLLMKAIQSRASDLHIEPYQDRVRVRIRVDGVLQPLTELPASFGPQVTSRIKVLAGADIAERRLHQDGRMWVRTEGREVDIRMSSYASAFGETIVMRLLDRNRGLVALHELGFEPRMLSLLRDIVLRTSSGLVLVTGPTGSGKTTTLYSFIDYINEPGVKTITCEDPVEYVLAGVTQCGVNEKSGPTFADSLRAIVRQDPDVIVVGEVRDPVTASMALEAALTGHKVFSTFHTEDAVGAVLRLMEMGAEPYLIASTLSCIVAQRLLRRVCPQCSRPAELRREDLRFLAVDRGDFAGQRLAMGRGCPHCNGSGYRGRLRHPRTAASGRRFPGRHRAAGALQGPPGHGPPATRIHHAPGGRPAEGRRGGHDARGGGRQRPPRRHAAPPGPPPGNRRHGEIPVNPATTQGTPALADRIKEAVHSGEGLSAATARTGHPAHRAPPRRGGGPAPAAWPICWATIPP